MRSSFGCALMMPRDSQVSCGALLAAHRPALDRGATQRDKQVIAVRNSDVQTTIHSRSTFPAIVGV
jgi:hypothetical protein